MSRHKTIRCPSEPIEDGVSLCFFSVDLSRRKAVLLRGGPLRKGLGGIITYTPVPLHHLSLASLEHHPFYPCLCKYEGLQVLLVLWHAVVLLKGAIVPQLPTVVPSRDAVVPRE